MRIAVYHNLTSGGAKRALNEQMKRLQDRLTFDVYTLESADHEFADIRQFAASYKIYPFNPLPLFESPFGRLNQAVRLLDLRRLRKLTRRIGAEIESEDYDVVYVNPCQFENAPGVIRSLRRSPAVFYCQEPLRIAYETMPRRPYDPDSTRRRRLINRIDPLPGLYRSALRRADRLNLLDADLVLVNSEFIRDAVRRIYKAEAQVSYLGVDTGQFRPLGLEKLDMVLSVGSLTPLKGFDFLIVSLAEIPESERPPLVIASNFQNPAEKAYLEALAGQKKVAVRLIGNVSEERLVELYNQARLTVYAPVREPFGFVSLESMACGTPVIAVREGGIQETVLHEQTGILVDRDPQLFAEAICTLFADPSKARHFGKMGQEHVTRRWTWERSVDILEGYLSSAAQTRSIAG